MATATPKLNKAVFGVKAKNHQLLKEAYLSHLSSGRENLAKAKKRGEVRGGGAKPWRQKGTGRARFGSSRNPIWTGGGVAFGPTGSENYQRKISTKSKHTALRQALSIAAEEDRVKIVDSIAFTDGKTKSAAKFIKDNQGRTLLVAEQKDQMTQRAVGNLANTKLISAKYLTVFDILNADSITISKKALEVIESWLSPAKTPVKESE